LIARQPLDAIDAAYKTVAVGGEAGSHIAVGTSVTKVSQNSRMHDALAPSGNLELEDDMRTKLFQTAESARVGHVARVPALIFALSVSIVVVALNSVQPAKAQNAGRERNIRECNLAETRERPDAEERGKTGSRGLRYKACMMERGEFE
jgi:hypothetical protein